MSEQNAARPVGGRDRIVELDVLRGVALFGVLTMNFIALAMYMLATGPQVAALPTAELDRVIYVGVRWLIGDKANTVFATLFGLGFYLQLKRGEGRPGFEARYRRRLSWLLVFGVLNVLLLWVWDILHVYAIAGFFLLAMRRWSTRSLVILGAMAALYSDKLQYWLIGALNLPLANSDHLFAKAAVLERQAIAVAGDYPALVFSFTSFTLNDWLLTGNMVAWIIYALGRFALGAAIGRSGILDHTERFIPLVRRIARIALPAGLLVNLVISLIYTETWASVANSPSLNALAEILRSPAALLLAAGYCAGIVLALQRPWVKRVFGIFAPVGRMALTNYLAQGLLYAFVMFGVGPGLGLAGRIGSAAVLAICIAFFAFQTVFSHVWLARYRFGPMEWVWRTLTYGERPAMRRAGVAAAAV